MQVLLRSPLGPVDTQHVKRRSVKVIKSRLEDIEVGDVVNRTPDAESGWFTVDAITTLFNGHLQLADVTEQLTVSGDHKDMVGLQLVEEVELDDRGLIAPAAPSVVTAAPVQPPVPIPAAAVPSGRPSGPPAGGSDADLASEAAVAAQIATGMNSLSTGGPHVSDDIDLALVAELLLDLDIGETPEDGANGVLAATSSRTAVLPDGARPVYGSELPVTPSYKNPVIVPEASLLPRRTRAA